MNLNTYIYVFCPSVALSRAFHSSYWLETADIFFAASTNCNSIGRTFSCLPEVYYVSILVVWCAC